MARSKTAWAQIKRWLKNDPSLRARQTAGGFSVSRGLTASGGKVAFLTRNKKGKWAATHNMMLDEDDSRYEHNTPKDAWDWWVTV